MTRNANPYLALGVRPFINCCSVRTVFGGSLMLPEVRAAMADASRQFVNLDELMEAAGARLAELTGAEWGIVTCGSAAAVALATAACVAGNDPAKMLRLPFTEGMANRVIMPRNQRFVYDQAIRMIGTHIVEIDDRAGLDAALAEPVAMVALLGTHEHLSGIRLEEIAAVVKPRGIPILVDAASEHLERPSPWLVRGADLVVYSGGKFLRGPQTSGLLLGSKPLVQAAWRNSSPHQALGRPMKVSKEDVVGLLAAVEYWFNDRDAAAERRRWRDDVETIARKLAGVAQTEVLEPTGVERVPRLLVRWDPAEVGFDGVGLRQRLLDGTPRIVLDDMSATSDSIAIEPFSLQPGEAAAVGDAIAAALAAGARATAAAPPATGPGPDVAGEWELRVRFLHGERVHRLRIGRSGSELTGQHQSAEFDGPVRMRLTPAGIFFGFDLRYEGNTIAYQFDGRVAADEMGGTVVLGSATDHHQGVVGLSQFGTGEWQAVRLR
ncbi:PLP-dependent transferase [Limobrevibacterium gyesilva]|uniref:PLP-dependent transferase n=1 Tax=Limobrevibacterium gyesilva TaxID=2991712 RepID=A0AA41YH97_9PROT|nr:PLP-dependent transferase [Limobrevibacterium gyesilva]MCW3473241.1 PLP-dependent transferase [Limobrevibacterium gyesilva]